MTIYSERTRKIDNIEHSCPSIDEIEKELKVIRKVNDRLRNLCYEYADELDVLEKRYDDDIEELKNKIEDLEWELKNL